MSANEVDPAKLEAFMGQAVTDMGAVISAPLFVIGERLGLYKAMAGGGPMSSTEMRRKPASRSAQFASGCETRRRAATSATTPTATPTSCRRSRQWRWPTRRAPSTCSGHMS